MQFLLTKAFWKGAWIWCKANWKFILGISIPIIIGIIARRGNTIAILKKGIESRDKLIETERKAAGLERDLKSSADKEFREKMSDLSEEYDKDLREVENQKKDAESRDLSARDATKELAEKFDLRNSDEK